jgi:hypothetical protein
VIAFTTTDGPALLRLIREDDRTIADLSLRKPGAVEKADILASPGQARLMLGNQTEEEAVITINEQTIKLAARAGNNLTDAADAGRKSPDSPEIDLPPGKLHGHPQGGEQRGAEPGVRGRRRRDLGPAGRPGRRAADAPPLSGTHGVRIRTARGD